MDDILERLPDEFNIAEIMQKNSNRSPYVVVCFQECERMNILLREIRVSLQQLDLGLKVSLKVELGQALPHQKTFTLCPFSPCKGELMLSPDMEAQQTLLSYDTVPDTWSKLAYPSTYGLAQW